ncbi:MAG: Phosphate acetyltransferase [Chlamydiia bacterium]|nr:Phosphate acetyltransferase [Chlamydiia bacterium]
MKQTILLAPVSVSVGLCSVSMGFIRVLENQNLKAKLLKPFIKDGKTAFGDFSSPLSIEYAGHLLSNNEEDKLLEFLVEYTNKQAKSDDIIVIEGIVYKSSQTFASRLNQIIQSALSAKVILVTSTGNNSLQNVLETVEIEAENFDTVLGCILNKVGAPTDQNGSTRIDLFDPPEEKHISQDALQNSKIKVIGCIPWKRSLMATDIDHIASHVNAKILNNKDYKNNKIEHFVLAAATLDHASKFMNPNVLVITSGDRSDIILGACMRYLNGVNLAGLLLTSNQIPTRETLDLCKRALHEGFPILTTKTDSLRTSIALQNIHTKHLNDDEQDENTKNYIAQNISTDWLSLFQKEPSLDSPSPSAFRFNLLEKAKSLHKTIVLPEGDDLRILEAANTCSRKNIASIVLLGKQHQIFNLCKQHNLDLDENIKIIDPTQIASNYIDQLVELRKHKGMSKEQAAASLKDPITVAMMMLKNSEVDGLVAGANTTTAHVVSPALKILKTAPGAKLVSSIFFMCLKSEVLVYGDCAINQNPTFEGLADIAIQSADSAKKFGLDPKIAMISYSTGSSGVGEDVEKVKKATGVVNELRPDLLCDGPLQYDAAKVPEVAAKKAPNSPVAGKASVFIFPDLNTANTTYKAVQRSANALSIGPMLQGLSKPVNDLSRGATIEDIIYTIAITAIGGS